MIEEWVRSFQAKWVEARKEEGEVRSISIAGGDLSLSSSSSILYSIRAFEHGFGHSFFDEKGEARRAFEQALSIAKKGRMEGEIEKECWRGYFKVKHKVNPVEAEGDARDLLLRLSEGAKRSDWIKQIEASIALAIVKREYADSYGSHLSEEKPYVEIKAIGIGRKNDRIERAVFRRGGIRGYELISSLSEEDIIKELEGKLKNLFNATLCKGGRYEVVCDPALSEVFFHEAVGHACEADHWLEGATIFSNKLGEQVASECITLTDNPLVEGEGGNYFFDDEGVRASETTLIERGKLIGLLHSLQTALLMRSRPTGNGRAQSPAHFQIPRMSNICLRGGDWRIEEMIKETRHGIYAEGLLGGSVEPTSGEFVFNAEEAFLIEEGEVKNPIKGFAFAGQTSEILKQIDAVSKETIAVRKGGACGKANQLVWVGGVLPYIRVKNVLVGGRA